MPRETISAAEKIEYVSILNDKGQLDSKLEPVIPEADLLKPQVS